MRSTSRGEVEALELASFGGDALAAVGRGGLGDDLTVDQEDHAVGVGRRDRVVGDHHDGLPERPATGRGAAPAPPARSIVSSAPVGSSAKVIAARLASARAMATRCC